MYRAVKNFFYFPVASYFRFLAGIRLSIWKPKVIVITGTSGKTTLLHFIASQLKNKAKYSYFANSSFGIPFDILGLKRKKLTPDEWLYLFIKAPLNVFKKFPKQKIYVVEADCDRPKEGKFLAGLLKPEVTLWTNVSRAHTMNFDSLVKENKMTSKVEETIAYEFGYFLETTSRLAILNGDSDLINKQMIRSKARIKSVSQKNTDYYKLFKDHTEFKINGKTYSINAMLPKETSLSIQMTILLLEYLKIKPTLSFSKFTLPPGRYSLFKGIKNTTIIDSSYNATPDGVRSILGMFGLYPASKKWLVLGDMIELGDEEKEEHEKLADMISLMKLDKIILVGPRLRKYATPRRWQGTSPLRWQGSDLDSFEVDTNDRTKTFLMPKEALDYLIQNLQGEEAILFKGARFLEGIIEHLLVDKRDVIRLCRRELIWQERRKKWGL